MAESILRVTEAARVPLVINDHPDLARQVGAAMVHLGQEDFFEAGFTHVDQVFTERSRPDPLAVELDPRASPGRAAPAPNLNLNPPGIGLSSHAPEQARRAVAAGAAYVAIGPVYATGTKPEARPVTLDYVRWAAAHVRIPWFAIGGLNLENLDEVLAAGARRICVVSAILNAPDVARACRQWRNRLSAVPLPNPSPDQPPPLLPT